MESVTAGRRDPRVDRYDPRVDQYIEALPEWQRDVARQVRRLVHEADPDVAEVIKRVRQPYFVLQGNICALLGAKDHLNVFIYDPIAPDPHGLINQGHDNATARGIQIRRDDQPRRGSPAGPASRRDRQQPRRRLAQDQGSFVTERLTQR